jgi:hypothetical protein
LEITLFRKTKGLCRGKRRDAGKIVRSKKRARLTGVWRRDSGGFARKVTQGSILSQFCAFNKYLRSSEKRTFETEYQSIAFLRNI